MTTFQIIDDKNIKSYLLLGEVLCDTHSLNQGLKLFKKAIALDEKDHTSHSFLLFNSNVSILILEDINREKDNILSL